MRIFMSMDKEVYDKVLTVLKHCDSFNSFFNDDCLDEKNYLVKEVGKPSPNISKLDALKFIEKHSFHYKSLPKNLLKDVDIATIALNKDIHNYEFMDSTLQHNKDFIVQALNKNSLLVQFVPQELLTEKYVLELTLFAKPYQPHVETESKKNAYLQNESLKHNFSNNSSTKNTLNFALTDDILKFFPESICNDRSIVLKTVSMFGARLQHVPVELKNDPEIVFTALKQDISYLTYIGEELKKDIGESDAMEYLSSLLLHNKLHENAPTKAVKPKKKL